MAKKKVLFVLSKSLGWSTYQRQIIGAVEARNDIEASFYSCEGSTLERLLTRRLPGPKLWRLVDPIFVWRRHLNRRWSLVDYRGHFDAIHVATQINALAYAELIEGPPFSIMIDQPRISPRNEFDQAWFSRASLEAERRIFDRASLIFSMSNWARDALIQNYSVASERIHVIPPSVRVPESPLQKNHGGLVNVGFIGNDFKRKGGPLLLSVHQKNLAERAILHIVSRGAAAEGKHKNVKYYKNIPNDRIVDDFLSKMDIFCLPTNSDQSSWVCAEASAAGLPIVATKVGGVPDFLIDGETGFLIDVGDVQALEQKLGVLIEDSSLRELMGGHSRDFAQHNLDATHNYNLLIDLIVQTIGMS